ncbi:protein kinase family protein [Actinomadura vinacea]|uniref:Protein kinase family protein n=1 Tax=Actinomadura vinacea TaxID=115336 RepID=A0ABN3JXE4_9ACTN
MSTSVIEPGTRLAGRYRLEERISDSGGSCLWKAIDEILARAVAVRTFDQDFPRIAEVVTSARAASRLTDPRLTQVFDADDSGESAYVVSEWVAGETLEQMLGKAPLEPGRAATLLYEAAEAITAAHEAGLAHLCLSPRDLVWTTGGTVKVLGIATDAVLADRDADDPAAQDVRGLGAMLYAALTAHWPGEPERSSLPAAPPASPGGSGEDGEPPMAPRQVQAGVPFAVDSIVCRCLGIEVPGQEPLTEPAELAKALRGVPRTPLPLFAGLANNHPAPPAPRAGDDEGAQRTRRLDGPPTRPREQPNRQRQQRPSRQEQRRHAMPQPAPAPQRTAPAQHAGHGIHAARPPARSSNRALLGVAAAALTVIVGLGAWALTSGDGDKGGATPPGTGKGRQSQAAKPQPTKLTVQNVTAAQQSKRGRTDTTIGKRLDAINDGRTGKTWDTQSYADVNFGNLAEGLGVTLDMGRPVQVSSVKVNVPDGGGILQVKIGDQDTPSALTPAGSHTTIPGENTINVKAQARGRYVLVWFTKLPSSLKGKISEIAVYGSAGG